MKKPALIYRFITALLTGILLLIIISGCKTGSKKDADEMKLFVSYRNIPGITDEEIEAIENIKKRYLNFNYGMTPSAEAFIAENSKIQGFSALFCEWLTELFGIPFNPIIYAWGDLLTHLETGKVDFTGEMTSTNERRKTYFMTDAIAVRSLKYFRLSGSRPPSEIMLSRPIRLAILEGTTTIDSVTAALGENALAIIPIDDSEIVYEMLKSGSIDAYVNEGPEESIFDGFGDVIAEDFFPPIYSPVSMTTKESALEPIISVVDKALNSGGIQHLTELYNQGYHDYLAYKLFLHLSGEELLYLHNNPIVPFAAEYDNYPICFFNSYEHQWQGISIDVLHEVESLTGLHFEVVNSNDTELPALIEMLKKGEASMISELLHSDEKNRDFLWPKKTIISDNSALISKSDLRNINANEVLYLKIGLSGDSAHAELFKKWFPNHMNSIEYRNFDDTFDALERGEVNLIMSSQFKLLKITNYRELVGYKANIIFDNSIKSTFGFNKDKAVLCSIIDKTLELIDTDKVSSYWLRRTYDYNVKLVRAQQPWLIGTSILLLLIIILMFFLFKKSRSTEKKLEELVNHRTAELSNQQDFMYLVNDAAALLLESETENITNSMIRGMEMIGRRIEVDRMFIWQNFTDNSGETHSKQVYRWIREGLTETTISQDFIYKNNLERWKDILVRNKSINSPINKLSESEYLFFSTYGIQSILVIPIFFSGNFWGFASFDDCSKQRIFAEGEVSSLRSWCLFAIGTIQRIKIALNLEAVTKNYKGIIWSVDNEGIITTFKGRYSNYLASYSDKLEGEKLEAARQNTMLEDIIRNVEKTFNEGPQDWINEMDGSVFHSYTAPMLDEYGNTVGIVGSTDNVTETVNLQRALEEASRAKSAFLARMSHEIRTPMNAIIGMTELIIREEIPQSAQEHIRTIRQAGSNLLSIINDILDFSKIETGKLDIIPSEYYLSSLINDVVNIIKTRVLESRLRFLVFADGNLPNALSGDVLRIRQVMLNLLSNAVKYTDRGFISLSITGEMTGKNNLILTIKVSDSGKGIKQEDIDKLFNEFTRVDLARNIGIEGTGLGLVITQNLIKAMNGKINVFSEYGVGSTFTVTLPQNVLNEDRLAVVENSKDISVLIYERRDIYIKSISKTMENLGINFKLVTTKSDFYNEAISKKYSFIFLASVLYEDIIQKYIKVKTGAKILLIAEYGETIMERNASVLTTPVFSIPIANSLNGVNKNFSTHSDHDIMERFTAPGAKVLIVDDINTNLKVVEGLLLPYKIQVDLCKNGLTAIEMAKSEYYDVVFMDHMMPEMDGIEAAARIRALGNMDPYYKKIPIVALTANAVSGTREMFYANGFDDFLPKPIDTIQLNAILEKWIPRDKQISLTGKNRTDVVSNESEIITIAGLNTKKGVAASGGSLKNYLKTLAVFYRDGIEKAEEIRACLEANDIPLYAIHVHGLKSAAAFIGADGLSESAAALEEAGKEKDLNYIHKYNDFLLRDMKTLLDNINIYLAEVQIGDNKESINMETLMQELSRLKTALNTFNSEDINRAVNILHDYTHADEIGNAISGILRNRLIGEYEEAVSMIDALIQKIGNNAY